MHILHSKTALNRPPRILCSENGNSTLKIIKKKILGKFTQNVKCSKQTGQISYSEKGKFCAQKMENFPNAMKLAFPWFSVPNRVILHSSRNSAIAESCRDWYVSRNFKTTWAWFSGKSEIENWSWACRECNGYEFMIDWSIKRISEFQLFIETIPRRLAPDMISDLFISGNFLIC